MNADLENVSVRKDNIRLKLIKIKSVHCVSLAKRKMILLYKYACSFFPIICNSPARHFSGMLMPSLIPVVLYSREKKKNAKASSHPQHMRNFMEETLTISHWAETKSRHYCHQGLRGSFM